MRYYSRAKDGEVVKLSDVLKAEGNNCRTNIANTVDSFINLIFPQVISLPFIKKPFQDLSHPVHSYAMENVMNIRLNVGNEGAEIGGWFFQPQEYCQSNLPIDDDSQYLKSKQEGFLIKENEIVILYLHGAAETRAHEPRRALYKLFQNMGYYVLAIDYRGYGDSSEIRPSQTSMVEDAKAAFNWLHDNSDPSSHIFIWGHSLGTGVTAKLAHVLTQSKTASSKLSGIFLEAPFNRMLDEVQTFQASQLLPWIGVDIAEKLSQVDMLFDSTHWLKAIKTPIFIMHAEDDKVIPFQLGSKLYEDLKNAGTNVEFHLFSSGQGLGHEGIVEAKIPRLLSDIVSNFVKKVLQS